MSTISVRNLDPITWDPYWGNGVGNYVSDIEAVALIISTSLKLFCGEFFLDLAAGTSMFPQSYVSPSILGYPGSQQSAASSIIQQTILGVPYVNGLSNVEYLFDATSRQYVWAGVAATVFGPISVATAPGLSASLAVPNNSTNMLTGN